MSQAKFGDDIYMKTSGCKIFFQNEDNLLHARI